MLKQLIEQLLFPHRAGEKSPVWQKCRQPQWRITLTDGSKADSNGQLWRRWRNGRWEYRCEPETFDQALDRWW